METRRVVSEHLVWETKMNPIRIAERTYRTWSTPILLELKEREDQLEPSARQALENVMVERRLLNTGNPAGKDRRKPESTDNS